MAMNIDDDYFGEEEVADPFRPLPTKDSHPNFYFSFNLALNLGRILVLISIIYYLGKSRLEWQLLGCRSA